jgi:hypothetical protein
MQLDNEDQRLLFAELINKASFPGTMLEFLVSVKQALAAATIASVEKKDE